MATAPTYPGVYIEEVPSGVHTITGVATSITAFVGYAPRGPVNDPTLVQSFTEYTRVFGGLSSLSTMSYAVQQFFANGGRDALIVRAVPTSAEGGDTPASAGTATIGTSPDDLGLEAANPGSWSENLLARVDYETSDKDSGSPTLFNLLIKDTSTGVIETLRNLAPAASLTAIVAQQSNLVRVTHVPDARPTKHTDIDPGDDPFDPAHTDRYTQLSTGDDGTPQVEDILIPSGDDGTGVYALAKADLFNLLVIPPFETGAGHAISSPAKGRATTFCQDHRAMFLVDPDPTWDEPSDLTNSGAFSTYIGGIPSDARKNAAIYFPYVRAPDPEQSDAIVEFPPSGAVAGVMARTDATRGVWKAPAGLDAGLAVLDLKAKLTDDQNGILNPLGVNCLRIFPAAGNVVWGARTLAGNDALASEWKYVPVRRTALFIEESLFRGTQWVVFEPNDEPLWAQIRLNVGAFMQNLFRQGAFQGRSPREAYFVKCDSETTTQNDIDLGIVNVLVGFAPLKPAEFVIIRIQQIAGQVAA
jgi:Bacteriophage tail sheath protein